MPSLFIIFVLIGVIVGGTRNRKQIFKNKEEKKNQINHLKSRNIYKVQNLFDKNIYMEIKLTLCLPDCVENSAAVVHWDLIKIKRLS